MKTAITLLAVVSCVFSPAAMAGWKTLAGHKDSVTLKKGETAWIVSVSEDMIVQYKKDQSWPPRGRQFRLGTNRCYQYQRAGSYYRRNTVVPSTKSPFPIAGPAKISIQSNGVMTMKVVANK